ncbi:MAG TPA: hypothetical protein VJB66_05385 [Candidatus Nanoarchaeia archaeon]|nr:hypothetical protein [Candidatus Nanoarchaeia archaeon]
MTNYGKRTIKKAGKDRRPTNDRQQQKIAQRQLELMKKGFPLGNYEFNREELYER